MADDRTFRSLQEALRFMESEIDSPASTRVSHLGHGVELRSFPLGFRDGGFTNVYDMTWAPGSTMAMVHISPRPVQASESADHALATASAGFFALADQASGLPAQSSLNLAINEGRVVSLPVADREAVVCREGVLTTDLVAAKGSLKVNGIQLTWAGSLSGHTADTYVYGNGNTVITSRTDPVTGRARVLDESSRFTPQPQEGGWVDVGFNVADNGSFHSAAWSGSGGLDIFAHDVVVRCPATLVKADGNRLDVLQVGGLQANDFPEYAVSVGPSLDYPDFSSHPINQDRSLGDSPPFLDSRKARMTIYQDTSGSTHFTLFDGRPGSPTFQGVTPSEAREAIISHTGYRWGCFLDPGQTAKIWTVEDGRLSSYGNRHYLRWPENEADGFTWIPEQGRPIASYVTLHPAPREATLRQEGVTKERRPEAGTENSSDVREAVRRAMQSVPPMGGVPRSPSEPPQGARTPAHRQQDARRGRGSGR